MAWTSYKVIQMLAVDEIVEESAWTDVGQSSRYVNVDSAESDDSQKTLCTHRALSRASSESSLEAW